MSNQLLIIQVIDLRCVFHTSDFTEFLLKAIFMNIFLFNEREGCENARLHPLGHWHLSQPASRFERRHVGRIVTEKRTLLQTLVLFWIPLLFPVSWSQLHKLRIFRVSLPQKRTFWFNSDLFSVLSFRLSLQTWSLDSSQIQDQLSWS